MLLTLSACTNANKPAQTETPGTGHTKEQTKIQYNYQLKAGEPIEVYDMTFDKMVTVTVDPDSTRDGAQDMRSDIFFGSCTFNSGLTIVGDYHAMISLDDGCSFGDGSIVSCEAVDPDAAKDTTLEDNLIKLFTACDGVTVETQTAMGVLTDGPAIVLNGTTYSKNDLTPKTDFLGIYSLYEGDTLTYLKLGIGEDDSVTFLD
ncbi:hypothetical protein [Mediterraneibacter massiliensis]|uniref:hypothetical protein n=1 Tax=Mediterraneibacter massiliensis TaxID=1720300 RepID=UPI0024ACED7F|nr:hypothetical protein [Mediterraneibacter massiliensis]